MPYSMLVQGPCAVCLRVCVCVCVCMCVWASERASQRASERERERERERVCACVYCVHTVFIQIEWVVRRLAVGTPKRGSLGCIHIYGG